MGRRIDFDEQAIWTLAYLGLSNRHIAQRLGCHQSTFTRRSDVMAIFADARAERARDIARLSREKPSVVLREADLPELVLNAERRALHAPGRPV